MNKLDSIRARIFVSCGQEDEEEKQISLEIECRLTDLGYEPYLAIYKQSTRSIIKNILNMLDKCEYFLFVDFKREQLIPGSREDLVSYIKDKSRKIDHRGSLFSNQELAVATYLEKPLIAFQESFPS